MNRKEQLQAIRSLIDGYLDTVADDLRFLLAEGAAHRSEDDVVEALNLERVVYTYRDDTVARVMISLEQIERDATAFANLKITGTPHKKLKA